MKIVSKRPLDLYFLIAGFLLLVGGLVGIWFVINKGAQTDQENTLFAAQTQTALYDNAVVIPAKTTPTPGETSGKTATPVSDEVQIASINLSRFYVHANPKTGLEDPQIPLRIEIPAINLDAPIVVADYNSTNIDGETFGQWQAPSAFAAGWQPDSALLGKTGNTVINGHHNEFGEVFGSLVDLEIGDTINIYSHDKKYSFIIANRMILQERFVDTATRLDNARWLSHTDDMRLTLVTCWPKVSNTHRLILVARPIK